MCTSDSACQLKGSQYYGWRALNAPAPVVPSTNPVLRAMVRLAITQGEQIQDALLDLVALTRQ
jgi:hypothetical protein